MLRILIGFHLILAVLLLLRKTAGQRLNPRLRYLLWLAVPLYLCIAPLWSIPVTLPEKVRPVVETAEEISGEVLNVSGLAPDPSFPAGGGNATDAYHEPQGELTEEYTSFHNSASPTETAPQKAPKPFPWQMVLWLLWGTGAAALLLLILTRNLELIRALRRDRIFYEKNQETGLRVWILPGSSTPFLLGRQIYLPAELELEREFYRHAVLHEACHLKQGDPLWLWVEYGILVLFWWSPLVWLSRTKMREDREMSCDEAVIRILGEGQRKTYAMSLLKMVELKKDRLSVTTAMFGSKMGLKQRVLTVAKHHRRSLLAALLVLAALGIALGCGMMRAREEDNDHTQTVDSEEHASQNSVGKKTSEVLVSPDDPAPAEIPPLWPRYETLTVTFAETIEKEDLVLSYESAGAEIATLQELLHDRLTMGLSIRPISDYQPDAELLFHADGVEDYQLGLTLSPGEGTEYSWILVANGTYWYEYPGLVQEICTLLGVPVQLSEDTPEGTPPIFMSEDAATHVWHLDPLVTDHIELIIPEYDRVFWILTGENLNRQVTEAIGHATTHIDSSEAFARLLGAREGELFSPTRLMTLRIGGEQYALYRGEKDKLWLTAGDYGDLTLSDNETAIEALLQTVENHAGWNAHCGLGELREITGIALYYQGYLYYESRDPQICRDLEALFAELRPDDSGHYIDSYLVNAVIETADGKQRTLRVEPQNGNVYFPWLGFYRFPRMINVEYSDLMLHGFPRALGLERWPWEEQTPEREELEKALSWTEGATGTLTWLSADDPGEGPMLHSHTTTVEEQQEILRCLMDADLETGVPDLYPTMPWIHVDFTDGLNPLTICPTAAPGGTRSILQGTNNLVLWSHSYDLWQSYFRIVGRQPLNLEEHSIASLELRYDEDLGLVGETFTDESFLNETALYVLAGAAEDQYRADLSPDFAPDTELRITLKDGTVHQILLNRRDNDPMYVCNGVYCYSSADMVAQLWTLIGQAP